MVVGDRSALIRRGCSMDWRPGWPLSGAVGNQRAATPVNRPSGAGCSLTRRRYIPGRLVISRLNVLCGAGCFLMGCLDVPGSGIQLVLMHLLVLGAF